MVLAAELLSPLDDEDEEDEELELELEFEELLPAFEVPPPEVEFDEPALAWVLPAEELVVVLVEADD